MERSNSKPKAFSALSKLGAAALIIAAILTQAVFLAACKQTINGDAPKHDITFNVEGDNGTLKAKTGEDEINSGDKVEEGKVITFTAKANEGYQVKGWKQDGKTIAEAGKGTEYKHTVTKACAITVSFELIPEEAILMLDPANLTIDVTAKTADGKPIEVEGCTETTLESEEDGTLHAKGTKVVLRGKITALNCNRDKLTALDVRGLTRLEGLLCRNNQLSTLDVSGLTSLKEVGCNGNQLATLNVKGCTALQKLVCFRNKLTAIDVQGLKSLEMLGIHGNQLTSINISGLTALKRLSCYANRIDTEAMTAILQALPTRDAGDNAKATLYTEKTDVEEGNRKDYTKPETLKTAALGAIGRNWKLLKEKPDGTEVDIQLEETHAITFNVEGGNGKLTAKADGIPETEASPISVEQGKKVTFTATPNAGYRVKGWKMDSNPISEAGTKTEYEHTVTKACTISVSFEAIPQHTITFSVDGANGTIKAEVDGKEIHSNDNIKQGKVITFTATPDAGYAVESWTITGASFENGSGTAYNNTAKLIVTANTEVKVRFIQGTVYTAGSVRFLMKDIDAVTNGMVGHNDQANNPPHQVNISAYRIGETEVTQELWQAVMGENPSRFKDSLKNPVENVNWYECIVFCNELTKKVTGSDNECVYRVLGIVYDKKALEANQIPEIRGDKKGFRLPYENEWEWAAKGGSEDKWPGTDDESKLGEYAWYRGSNAWKTHEVKMKKPNGYGLYDMSGNVFEFCWEKYSSSSDARLARGGNWDSRTATHISRAFKEWLPSKNRDPDRGLRVVCSQ